MLTKSRLVTIGLWLCLLALGVLVYLPGLPGGFMFDDLESIVYNPAMRLDSLGFDNLYFAILSSPTGGLMRPLSMLSFAFDAYFFGLNTLPFKLTNIFIHAACGLMLWWVARELLRAYTAATGRTLSEKTMAWCSSMVTALWLVHPLNLTVVLYTVQRETSLSAFFTAGAMLSYLIGRRREREGRSGLALIWVVTPLLTAVGMLCKETAALLPVYLLVMEVTLLRFTGPGKRVSRNACGFQVLFLALPLSAAVVYLLLRPSGFFAAWYFGRDFDLYERLLTEARVVLDYLRWVFVPDIRQLALYHDDLKASRGLFDPPSTFACLLGIGLLLAAAIAIRKRLPLLSFGLLWFFAGQLLESTILPLELMFEHRNYLPIFGLIAGVSGTLWLLANERHQARIAKLAGAACLVLLASVTTVRAWEWHSQMSFAQYEVAHQPHSPRALAELGWSYGMYLNVTHDYSIIPYAVATELKEKAADPLATEPDVSIADIYAVTGDLPKAKQYLQIAASDARTAEPTNTFLFTLETLRHWKTEKDPELRYDIDAIFDNAAANPKVTKNSCYLAAVLNTYGILRETNGDIPTSAQLLHRAATLCPGNALIRINFAYLLLKYNDPKDAREQVDAIRQIHDIRYLGQLQLLENALREESSSQHGATH